MLKEIKGAIFDLDGTLIDSMGIWQNIGSEFLLSYGITPPQDIEEILKPMSFLQSAQYFREVYNIKLAPQEIMGRVYEQVGEHYKHTIPLKEGVQGYLELLKEKGIKMCIATASNKELAASALERLGVLRYFEFIVTCDEIGKSKDEPDIYLKAADILELNKRDVCIFEDALYCAKTAKNAGFQVTGVYDDSSKHHTEDLQAVCDHYIVSFKELL